MAKVPRHLLPQSTFNRGGTPTKAAGHSKIGPTAGMTDRNVASAESLTANPLLGDNKTQVDTYFTSGPIPGEGTAQIYTGDRRWARISLTLETAGPVAIGTSSKITPVLGGGGRLLLTNQTIIVTLAKGTKLYVASTGVNRIGRVIEPVPWLEQIVGLVAAVGDRIASVFASGKSRG